MSFFHELKRRNVFRVGIAYAITGWLIMQVGEVMAPALKLPDWVLSTLAFFLILGFPLAMIFAWAFEMTPEGLKREKDVDRSQSVTASTGRRLDRAIMVVLVLAVVFLLAERFISAPQEPARPETAGTAAVAEPAPAAAVAPEAVDDRRAVAVLPFQNLSTSEENAFFASGVHEDILTYLSRVGELRVNSRTSVQQYAGSQLNMKDIATQLGARYIVEGSVRRAGNQVRVTAQLIDASTDEHLWAENFDRELTDIFAIQTAIAQEIVAALKAELSPNEAEMLAHRPTDNVEAYDLFLRARLAMQDADKPEFGSQDTIADLERAVELDPEYAEAWALLATAHGEIYWFMEDRSEQRLASMKAAVDRALEINPRLPEARLALAMYHYRGYYEYPEALQQLQQAEALLPNDALVHYNLGLVYRRLGDYEASVDALLEAARLEPDYTDAWAEALHTAEEAQMRERAVAIERQIPERFLGLPRIMAERSSLAMLQFGDLEKARRLMADHTGSDNYSYVATQYYLALYERDFESAARIARAPQAWDYLTPGWGMVEAAAILEYAGDAQKAAELRLQADAVLAAEVEKPYAANYAWPHIAYARNLAGLGRKEQALASCERGMAILPAERDHIHGVTFKLFCAEVKTKLGMLDEAIDDLEWLEGRWSMSRWDLALNPAWDPLRGDPRFEALAPPNIKVTRP